jgi:hypothetical protein
LAATAPFVSTHLLTQPLLLLPHYRISHMSHLACSGLGWCLQSPPPPPPHCTHPPPLRRRDPGNWATDLAAGSAFGYSLLFVVLLSSVCAMFLQVAAEGVYVCVRMREGRERPHERGVVVLGVEIVLEGVQGGVGGASSSGAGEVGG